DALGFGGVGWRVDELGPFDEGGGLGEPRRVPERLDFAAHLIARAGTPVEAVEGRRLQKQRPHHGLMDPPISHPSPSRDHPEAAPFPAYLPAQKAENENGERQ